MKHIDWIRGAHTAVQKAIVECFNNNKHGDWSENHITARVLEKLNEIGSEFDWEDKPQKVKLETYKLKSNLESDYGDIAILVKVMLTDSIALDGVAFYEAKKQYIDKNGKIKHFGAVKEEQLSNISSNTTATNVLLYELESDPEAGESSSRVIVRATSISTEFVKQLFESESFNSEILNHKYGEFWVKALGNNLLGLNLDFRPKAVEEIMSMARENEISYVMNASVTVEDFLELKLDSSFSEMDNLEKFVKQEAEVELEDDRNKGMKF